MATIINNPSTGDSGSNAMGMIVGGIVLLVLGGLFIVYGLPAISRMRIPTPQVNVAAPQIQMPDKVEVQVTEPTE